MSFEPPVLGRDNNFLGLEAQYSSYDVSPFIIIQAPLERTTSYGKGTARGPLKILEASRQVEFYDETLDEIPAYRGIATLEQIDFKGAHDTDTVIRMISNSVKNVSECNKFPIVLGGEHTVTAGCVKGLTEAGINFSVLQLDAHSDLRDAYEDDPYSHASVMRRVWDIQKSIVLCGIRSQCMEEARFIREHDIPVFYAHTLAAMIQWDAVLDHLGDNVYLTIDCDYFDPSVMPAVGTPEPGGFAWRETLDFLTLLVNKKNIVGFDVVELAPAPELVYADFTAARLIYRLIGLIGNARQKEFPFLH